MDTLIMPPPDQKPANLLLSLTHREREVLEWMAEGKTNWEIGNILGCSHETAKKHAHRIMKKLGVENRTCAANYLRLHREL